MCKDREHIATGKTFFRNGGTLYAVMYDHPVMGYKMTDHQGNEQSFPSDTEYNTAFVDHDAFSAHRKKKLIPYDPNAQRSMCVPFWKGDKLVNPEPEPFKRFCRQRSYAQAGWITGQGSNKPSVKESVHRVAHKHSHDPNSGSDNNPAVAAMNTKLQRKRMFEPFS